MSAKVKKKELGLGAPPRSLTARFDELGVLQEGELVALLKTHRTEWHLASALPVIQLVDWLVHTSKLKEVEIVSELRGGIARYLWGSVSPYRLALSLARNSFLSHASAASVHKLLTFNPDTIFVNREQSPKPAPAGDVNQEALHRAFAGSQRTSRNIYRYDRHRIVLLNGKNSGNLGVQTVHFLNEALPVTGIERTLIDLTVRADYAGGPHQVLEAFRRAKQQVSVEQLVAILVKLDYKYPYHQAIGFYMQRAGYGEETLSLLRNLGVKLEFYVGYGVEENDFDSTWRIHFPKGL